MYLPGNDLLVGVELVVVGPLGEVDGVLVHADLRPGGLGGVLGEGCWH